MMKQHKNDDNTATFLLVDGHSLIHRAYHAALPELKAKDGTPTKAVYGYFRLLLAAMTKHKPKYVFVAFDGMKKHLIRREIYPGYKAKTVTMNKAEKAEAKMLRAALTQQIKLCRVMTEHLGLSWLTVKGYEGDDLIASVYEQFRHLSVERGKKLKSEPLTELLRFVVLTGDKDLYALTADNDLVIDDMATKQMMTCQDVLEKHGVHPRLWPEVKALCGDTGDNIPGVAGIGWKKAAQLIDTYRTAGNVVRCRKDIKMKPIQNCMDELQGIVRLSSALVKLMRDAPVEADLEEYGVDIQKALRNPNARRWFTRMQLGKLIERYTGKPIRGAGQ